MITLNICRVNCKVCSKYIYHVEHVANCVNIFIVLVSASSFMRANTSINFLHLLMRFYTFDIYWTGEKVVIAIGYYIINLFLVYIHLVLFDKNTKIVNSDILIAK